MSLLQYSVFKGSQYHGVGAEPQEQLMLSTVNAYSD